MNADAIYGIALPVLYLGLCAYIIFFYKEGGENEKETIEQLGHIQLLASGCQYIC